LRERQSLSSFTRYLISSRAVSHPTTGIVGQDLDLWHRQPFGILLHELAKARRTAQGASSQVHALFGTVPTTFSIIEYGKSLATWFHEARQQNNPSAEVLLSAIEAQAFVSFVRQCAHDATLPAEHRGIYQRISADILADSEKDASTFNMLRWKPYFEHLQIAGMSSPSPSCATGTWETSQNQGATSPQYRSLCRFLPDERGHASLFRQRVG